MTLKLDDPNGYVGFASFGLDKLDSDGQLDALLRDLPAVRPTAADIITTACYQTEYGIYDHDQPGNPRPLALVAYHPKEDSLEGGPLFSHIRKFVNYRIAKLTGLDLMRFLELPLHVVELLYDIAGADAQQQNKTHQDVQKQLNLDFKGPVDDD